MKEKSTGLAAYSEKNLPPTSERQRGKGEVVAFPVRLRRPDWERLHLLAVKRGVSLQALVVRGLNHVFNEDGQDLIAGG